MHKALPVLAAALALASAAPASAQTATPDPEAATLAADRVTIGAGVATVPDFEGSDNNSVIPGAVVVGQVSGIEFWTRGTQLYVDLVPDAAGPGLDFELGPIAAVRLDRTSDIDDPQVEALGERKTAIELGGFVGIAKTGLITSAYDTLSARVAWVRDVNNAHDSYVLTPQLNYTTPLSRATLVSLGLSADYVGKRYGDYYFSVTPAGNAASGLPIHDVDGSGWKRANISFFALQSLTGDLRRGLGIGGGVQYGRLLGDYRDSPVVRNADQWAGAIGLSYTF